MADDNHNLALSRRRLLTSLATIGGSLSAAGVGTWALFSDREQQKITVQAGTVDLSVEGGPEPVVTIDDVTAGTSGTERLELTNTGTMDAGIVVCLGEIDYRRADDAAATDESDSEHDEGEKGSKTGSGKVSDVDFAGCGTAKVYFDDDFDGTVDVTVEYGNGETSDRAVSVDDEETPLRLERSGEKNGYIASVTVDGTTYRNDSCKHAGETENGNGSGNGANGNAKNSDDDVDDKDSPLTDALTVEIGLEDENGSREVLFAEDELEELIDGGTCAAANGHLASGAKAALYVDWQTDKDAEGLSDQAVDLDIEINLQA